jgi:hypothetical protein
MIHRRAIDLPRDGELELPGDARDDRRVLVNPSARPEEN